MEVMTEPLTWAMESCCKRNSFWARTKEKWELNQYWYSPNTITMLTKEIEEHAPKVAFLSTPSVWFSLGNLDIKNRSFFFDVDTQWEKHSNYVHWNYYEPSEMDPKMHHEFDCVVIDPPFVTAEVWAKYAEAALLLLGDGGKIILSTIPRECVNVEGDAERRAPGISAFYSPPGVPICLLYQLPLHQLLFS